MTPVLVTSNVTTLDVDGVEPEEVTAAEVEPEEVTAAEVEPDDALTEEAVGVFWVIVCTVLELELELCTELEF